MVSTWDGCNVLDKHSSSISEWITVHIGMYCIRMDNTVEQRRYTEPDVVFGFVLF